MNVLFLIGVLGTLASNTDAFGYSCNFRCQQKITLFDYLYPIGCYCHSTCGGELPCCSDQYICGSEQACMTPSTVSDATHTGGMRLFYGLGETITYTCNTKHEMIGPKTRTCIIKGIWTRPPRCQYVLRTCSAPTIDNSGHRTEIKDWYKSGESIHVECNEGFERQGPAYPYCFSYSWRPSIPKCVPKRCQTRNYYCSDNADCVNYEYYSKCVCHKGYHGSGMTCNPIPCYKHTCKSTEKCVDGGDGSNSCECKDGYKRVGNDCIKDPCHNNQCHRNASCVVSVNGDSHTCNCNLGFSGNGTTCTDIKQFLPEEGDEEDNGSGSYEQ